jgi:hypothetical protein
VGGIVVDNKDEQGVGAGKRRLRGTGGSHFIPPEIAEISLKNRNKLQNHAVAEIMG